ncbi:MAG TPA: F0F1 ATP synthase subunit B [Anaerolineaceae bacterium]|nr:F0F1 ATP synthase subunit B [Anaerolineaceae bacterium]
MEALGINLGYVLLQIFMFGILMVVLYAWVYKPILNLLANRRKAIAQGLEDARIAGEARANAERDAEKILAEAQAKAAQVVREATERAEVASRDVRANAETEANKARETALAEVEQERNRILGELRGQVAALAISAAQKLVAESLDERRQHAILEEFFAGVRNGKVTVLDNIEMNGTSAEVTSALPLTSDEQDLVKRDILAKTGSAATVSFRVDPSILGGLVVRVGDKVMDGSVSGQLQNMRQSIA